MYKLIYRFYKGRHLIGILAFLVICALVLPQFLSPYDLSTAVSVISFAIAIAGINLTNGFAGAPNIGQGIAVGGGAYITIVAINSGLSDIIAVLAIAVLFIGISAFLIGTIIVTLKGLYFAISTFILALLFPMALKMFPRQTGGVNGLELGGDISALGMSISTNTALYYLAVILAFIVFVHFIIVTNGPKGREWGAIRDDEMAAIAYASNPVRSIRYAFVICSIYGAIGGCLYALNMHFVAPDSFVFEFSLFLYVASLLGGTRTVFGAIVGGIFLQYVPIYISEIHPAASGAALGLFIIIISAAMPFGIVGVFYRLKNRR